MRQLRDAEPKPRYADYERVAPTVWPRAACHHAVDHASCTGGCKRVITEAAARTHQRGTR